LLVVVLNKGGQKKFIGEGDINARTNKPENGSSPRLGQHNIIIRRAKRDAGVGLDPVAKINVHIVAVAFRIIATKSRRNIIRKKFLRL